jgi:tRNA-binding protein
MIFCWLKTEPPWVRVGGEMHTDAMITYDDFVKAEIRVGTVVDASVPEGSRSVIKLTVHFGEEVGEKTIFSGILKWYQPEDLRGKQFAFVLNLPPKKMGDLGESEGMIMAAVPKDAEGNETAVLMPLVEKVPDGTRVR